MKLILMTQPAFFVEEDKILASLFDEGLDNLHLNKPGTSPMYSERLLMLLPEESYGRITVHSHYYLKEEYKLRGIHINDTTAQPPANYRGRVSRTCHKADELREAKRNADYVFLANAFANGGNPAAYTNDELVNAARRGLIDGKVYALGGINGETIRAARDMGFGGVVVCDDLWSRFDIHHGQDFKELMQHFKRLRKAVE